MRKSVQSFDVVIVGAGPGGIAAAVTVAEGGRSVGIIDDSPHAGGQIWRNRGERPSLPGARRWLDRLDALGQKIVRLHQTRVVAASGERELLAEGPNGPIRLRWTSLVLATGARELFIPFPGWTLPGVFGAGAIQALMKMGLPVAGKRVVVAGTGPLLLAVADLLREKGAEVPLILEQTPPGKINQFAFSLIRNPAKLLAGIGLRMRLMGTRYATGSYPLRVERAGQRLKLDFRGRDHAAAIECDYVACGFNLIPNTELPQLLGCELTRKGAVRVNGRLRTSVEGIYAIGELTGVGGVEKALLEGRLAALSILNDEPGARRLDGQHRRALDFTRRLDAAFQLRSEVLAITTPETIVCRCEDVRLSAVRHSMNARDAKLQTRCGMGPCQGRVCGAALQRLLGTEAPQVRPPVLTTSVRTLAAVCTIAEPEHRPA